MTFADLLVTYLPQIITGASIISAALPEPKADSVGASLKKLVNLAALNVGNATNQTAVQKKQRKNAKRGAAVIPLLLVGALGFVLSPTPANADTLSWTLPTTRENGEVLAAGDLIAVKVYSVNAQNVPGGTVTTLPGNATSFNISSCKQAGFYAVSALANVESALSNTVEVKIDAVGCRPKAPALSVK